MTQVQLDNSIISIRNEYLTLNSKYFDYVRIGSQSTALRYYDSLFAVNILLKGLLYYAELEDKEKTDITEEEVYSAIAECIKLLKQSLMYEKR